MRLALFDRRGETNGGQMIERPKLGRKRNGGF